MKEIVHIITGLGGGGAETMLYKLLCHQEKGKYSIKVISMTDRGVMAEKIEKLGIQVYTLDMKRGIPTIKALLKAKKICKNARIIQTWLYHADLLGYIVGKVFYKKKVIWGVRQSNLDKRINKRTTLIVAKINSFLSKKVDFIISCSKEAVKTHTSIGYCKEKFVIIPNGFDLNRFYKINHAKIELSNEIQINEANDIILAVGRWDAAKGYETLLKSVSLLKESHSNFICLIAGENLEKENILLAEIIKKYNVEDHIHLLGRRDDIPKLMSAADVFVLSSEGEGFPNVLGEAMACETVCVATNVGDSKYIVDRFGMIVEKNNAPALQNGMIRVLSMTKQERQLLGKEARKRISDEFNIIKIVERYEVLYT